jgi:acyl-CoA thioesterase I
MVAKTLIVIASLLWLQTTSVKTILFFGDSLTAGYGLSTEEAFPALVEKKLNEKEKRCKVINAGLSGETTAGGLARIDWILRQPIDIFVLELGGNDGLRGLPLEQTEKNLQAIIDKVKAKYPNTKILLAGMMVPPNMGADYSKKFQTIYPTLAKKNKAGLIPFLLEGVGGNDKLNLPDGIHPNPEGHRIVATTIYGRLKLLL